MHRKRKNILSIAKLIFFYTHEQSANQTHKQTPSKIGKIANWKLIKHDQTQQQQSHNRSPEARQIYNLIRALIVTSLQENIYEG